jgi:hypothetical protein
VHTTADGVVDARRASSSSDWRSEIGISIVSSTVRGLDLVFIIIAFAFAV